MKIILILLISISPITTSCLARTKKTCIESEYRKVLLNGKIGSILTAKSCESGAGTGQIKIKIFHKNRTIQTLTSSFESIAYSMRIDTEFDIDNDGTPDLRINTGKGKDGDGMHYWRYDTALNRYTDFGEWPNLNHCKNDPKKLFSLVSSSGEMQAIRYDYTITSEGIFVQSGIAFMPLTNSDNYHLIELIKSKEGGLIQSNKSTKTSNDIAESYMGNLCLQPSYNNQSTD